MNHEGYTTNGPYYDDDSAGFTNQIPPPASSVYSSTYDDIPLQSNLNLSRAQTHLTQNTQTTASSTFGILPGPPLSLPPKNNNGDGSNHSQRARKCRLFREKCQDMWTRASEFTKKRARHLYGQEGSVRRAAWVLFIILAIAASITCGVFFAVTAHKLRARARGTPTRRLERALSNHLPEKILVLDPPSYDQHLDVFGQQKARPSASFIAMTTVQYPLYQIPANHTIRHDPALEHTHPIFDSAEFLRCGSIGRAHKYNGPNDDPKRTIYRQLWESAVVSFRESVVDEAYVLYFEGQIQSCWIMTEEMLRIQKEWDDGTGLDWLDLYFSKENREGRKQKAVGDWGDGNNGEPIGSPDGSPQVILP